MYRFVVWCPLQSLLHKLQAQLTYRTATGKSYSFYVCFGEGCAIEGDDCVVDVSDDNVVVLVTKDSKGVWGKFQVGLNAQQTNVSLVCCVQDSIVLSVHF